MELTAQARLELELLDTQPTDEQAKALVQMALDDTKDFHDDLERTYDRLYDAYRGVLTQAMKAAKFGFRVHPAIAFQLIETIVANLLDDDFSVDVTPQPKMASPDQLEKLKDASQAVELRIQDAQRRDKVDEKQRPFIQQASVYGISPSFVGWRYEERLTKKRRIGHFEAFDAETGVFLGVIPQEVQDELLDTVFDDPTWEPFNVRDFWWPESAASVKAAPWLMRVLWKTPKEIKDLQKDGYFNDVELDWNNLKGSAEDRKARQDAVGPTGEPSKRKRSRTKDLIPLYDYWTEEWHIVVAGTGTAAVVLKNEENPYWFSHSDSRKPFVCATTCSDMFELPGISDVELIEEEQMALWQLASQRLTNLELINNGILIINEEVEGADDFEFYPLAKWYVPGDVRSAVDMWNPNPLPAQVSFDAEDRFKSWMNDVTGGTGVVAGAESTAVDTSTATGVVANQNVVQRRLQMKKAHVTRAMAEVAYRQIELCQQFDDLESPGRFVEIIGPGGIADYKEIVGADYVDVHFFVNAKSSSKSLIQSERMAQAQARVQILLEAAPVLLQLGQPIDVTPAIEDYLRESGELDPDRYFLPKQAPAGQVSGPGQQLALPPGQDPAGQGPLGSAGNGVTNPSLAAGPLSPSNDASMNPGVFQQQAGAATGGAVNQ